MGNNNTQPLIKEKLLDLYCDLTYLSKHEINKAYQKYEIMLKDPENKFPKKEGFISYNIFLKHIPQMTNNPFNSRIFRVFTCHNNAVADASSYENRDLNESAFEAPATTIGGDFESNFSFAPSRVSRVPVKETARDTTLDIINENMSYRKTNKANPRETQRQTFQIINKVSKNSKMSFLDFLDFLSVFSYRTPDEVKSVYAFKIFDYDEDNLISEFDLKVMISKLTKVKFDDDVESLDLDTTFADSRNTINQNKTLEQSNINIINADKRPVSSLSAKNKFITSVSKAILKEASALHRKRPESGIRLEDFQKILLQNEEFKSHFSFAGL